MDEKHKSEKKVVTSEEEKDSLNQNVQENSQNNELTQEDECNYSCNGSETSKRKPPSSREPTAEDYGLRQHERHILFHFFTLFSISFFIGVLFIHLSIWINSNYISNYTSPPSDKSDSTNGGATSYENFAWTEKFAMPDRRQDEVVYDENFNYENPAQIPTSAITISAFAKNVTV